MFEIHDDVEVLKRMGLAFGLDSGLCTPEQLKIARSFVPKALQPYVTGESLNVPFIAARVYIYVAHSFVSCCRNGTRSNKPADRRTFIRGHVSIGWDRLCSLKQIFYNTLISDRLATASRRAQTDLTTAAPGWRLLHPTWRMKMRRRRKRRTLMRMMTTISKLPLVQVLRRFVKAAAPHAWEGSPVFWRTLCRWDIMHVLLFFVWNIFLSCCHWISTHSSHNSLYSAAVWRRFRLSSEDRSLLPDNVLMFAVW